MLNRSRGTLSAFETVQGAIAGSGRARRSLIADGLHVEYTRALFPAPRIRTPRPCACPAPYARNQAQGSPWLSQRLPRSSADQTPACAPDICIIPPRGTSTRSRPSVCTSSRRTFSPDRPQTTGTRPPAATPDAVRSYHWYAAAPPPSRIPRPSGSPDRTTRAGVRPSVADGRPLRLPPYRSDA